MQIKTDQFAEFIIQLLDRPPFHIVGPAINIPVEHICEIFLEKGIIEKPSLDSIELGSAAVAGKELFGEMETDGG